MAATIPIIPNVINTSANAKLISANDSSGFTYRGRFIDDGQAMTMSYDALERVTNAKTDFAGANILGFHFEGPYISAKQALSLLQLLSPTRLKIPPSLPSTNSDAWEYAS